MNKYKVYFSGFCYIVADNEEEAMEFYIDAYDYMEYEPIKCEQVDDFERFI